MFAFLHESVCLRAAREAVFASDFMGSHPLMSAFYRPHHSAAFAALMSVFGFSPFVFMEHGLTSQWSEPPFAPVVLSLP